METKLVKSLKFPSPNTEWKDTETHVLTSVSWEDRSGGYRGEMRLKTLVKHAEELGWSLKTSGAHDSPAGTTSTDAKVYMSPDGKTFLKVTARYGVTKHDNFFSATLSDRD